MLSPPDAVPVFFARRCSSMSFNLSICPAPFIDPNQFNESTGYIPGRYCGGPIGVNCCLPCPLSQWVFDDHFKRTARILRWFSPISVLACAFLLLSWLVLPKEFSRRHYLTIGLVVSVMFIGISLTIPLFIPPDLCADAITPADDSDSTCAWSGSLFMVGALGVVIWTFLRVLWLHLHVVWAHTPGPVFVIASSAIGILVPFIFLGVTFGVSGFSYRLGITCFVKIEHSFQLFWGWLVGFACASVLLQIVATGYCIWVYVMSHRARKIAARQRIKKSHWRTIGVGWLLEMARSVSEISQSLHSSRCLDPPAEIDPPNPNAVRRGDLWRGIRDVFKLQWRIIVLSVALAVQTLYFCTLTWAGETRASNAREDPQGLVFGRCLVMSGGDRTQCFQYATYILINRNASVASLAIMSLAGVEVFLLLVRLSLFRGWWLLVCNPRYIFPSHRRQLRASQQLNRTSSSCVGSSPVPLLSVDQRDTLTDRDPPRRTRTTPARLLITEEMSGAQDGHIALRDMLAEMPPDALLGSLSPRHSDPKMRQPVSPWQQSLPFSPFSPSQPAKLKLDDNEGAEIMSDEGSSALPAHLLNSGIAHPEILPWWEKITEGSAPVLDLGGDARGGLRMHPVSKEDL